jgi:ribonuclease VapC
MVIDTSVLIAILANEPEAELLEAAIGADPVRLISAASVLEAAIVAEARYGGIGGRELDLLLYKAEIQIVAVTPDQVDAGRREFSNYGKGRQPAAMELRGLFFIRPGADLRRTASLQGQRFLADRRIERAVVIRHMSPSEREKFPLVRPHIDRLAGAPRPSGVKNAPQDWVCSFKNTNAHPESTLRRRPSASR